MKHFFRIKSAKKIGIASVSGLLVAGLLAFGSWANFTGYIHCISFQVTGSATDAMKCGNYYFGVYGSRGYDVYKAESYFVKALTIDKTVPDAWHQYARIAFLRADYKMALVRINKQFQFRGDELMASYYIRGLIEGYAGNFSASENDFKRFLEWDPTNWAAHNDLAWVYFSEGKFKEAKDQASIGLSFNQKNPWLHLMRGMSYFNLKDTKNALIDLEEAKREAAELSEEDWSHSYPGNDPRVGALGLTEFKKTIEEDLVLVRRSEK